MAKFYLINTVQVGAQKYFAGDEIDDAVKPKADIDASGGICWAQNDAIVNSMALLVQRKRATKAISEQEANDLMMSAAGAAARTTSPYALQAGTATLAAGTATVTGVTLTANSRIVLAMKDSGAGALTAYGELVTPAASRNVGAGTFVIQAIDNTKTLIATATPTVDWFIFG